MEAYNVPNPDMFLVDPLLYTTEPMAISYPSCQPTPTTSFFAANGLPAVHQDADFDLYHDYRTPQDIFDPNGNLVSGTQALERIHKGYSRSPMCAVSPKLPAYDPVQLLNQPFAKRPVYRGIFNSLAPVQAPVPVAPARVVVPVPVPVARSVTQRKVADLAASRSPFRPKTPRNPTHSVSHHQTGKNSFNELLFPDPKDGGDSALKWNTRVRRPSSSRLLSARALPHSSSDTPVSSFHLVSSFPDRPTADQDREMGEDDDEFDTHSLTSSDLEECAHYAGLSMESDDNDDFEEDDNTSGLFQPGLEYANIEEGDQGASDSDSVPEVEFEEILALTQARTSAQAQAPLVFVPQAFLGSGATNGPQAYNFRPETSKLSIPSHLQGQPRVDLPTRRQLLRALPKPGQPGGLEAWITYALEGTTYNQTDCVICKLTASKPKYSQESMRRHLETPHRLELAKFFEMVLHDPDQARLDPRAFENVVLYFMFAAPWLRKTHPNDKRLETELSAFLGKYSTFMPATPNRPEDIAYARYKAYTKTGRGRLPKNRPTSTYELFPFETYPRLSKLAGEAVEEFAPWKCFCTERYSRMDAFRRHIRSVSVKYTKFDTGHGWTKFADDPVRAITEVMPDPSRSHSRTSGAENQ